MKCQRQRYTRYAIKRDSKAQSNGPAILLLLPGMYSQNFQWYHLRLCPSRYRWHRDFNLGVRAGNGRSGGGSPLPGYRVPIPTGGDFSIGDTADAIGGTFRISGVTQPSVNGDGYAPYDGRKYIKICGVHTNTDFYLESRLSPAYDMVVDTDTGVGFLDSANPKGRPEDWLNGVLQNQSQTVCYLWEILANAQTAIFAVNGGANLEHGLYHRPVASPSPP